MTDSFTALKEREASFGAPQTLEAPAADAIRRIEKRGFIASFSWESILDPSLQRRGHPVQVGITEEDARLHAQAKAALEVIQDNPWIHFGYESDEIELRPLEKTEWVWDETEEEYQARLDQHDIDIDSTTDTEGAENDCQ